MSDTNLKDNVEIFLMGDFNIDLKNKKSPLTNELEITLKRQIKGTTRPSRKGSNQDYVKITYIYQI